MTVLIKAESKFFFQIRITRELLQLYIYISGERYAPWVLKFDYKVDRLQSTGLI